jgi:plasmid maintenance system antidote protein VapI
MEPRDYFLGLVEKAGGLPAAAVAWGIPYPTLAAIANGGRGISKAMAERIANSSHAEASRLVWVRATKTQAKAA